MIKSMTGYGKAQCRFNEKDVTIEVRSLNGKNLDISLKTPQVYKDKDQVTRSLLASELQRGKIELLITVENHGKDVPYVLNKALFKKYFDEISNLSDDLGASVSTELIPAILRLPEVIHQESRTADEQEWSSVLNAIKEAIGLADAYRVSEGKHLCEDLIERIKNISNLLQTIEPLEQSRSETIRIKIRKALDALKEENSYDHNRFEQELIYYLEKIDITEEKVRLRKHLDYFLETLTEDESAGKKLGFISQEIGREINTIGSKAYDADIQKIVVQMKDELEKIKEQLMNIL